MGSFGNFSFGGVVVLGGGSPIFLAVKTPKKLISLGTETVSKATLNAQIFFWNMWSYQKCGFILVGVDARRKCVTRGPWPAGRAAQFLRKTVKL